MLIMRVIRRCHRARCQTEAFDESETGRALAGVAIDRSDPIDA